MIWYCIILAGSGGCSNVQRMHLIKTVITCGSAMVNNKQIHCILPVRILIIVLRLSI